MTRLWISPHLDDVALSCAGRLGRARAAGETIVVATVFSAGDDGYEQRRAEDRHALAALGATVIHLGFPDGPFRPGVRRTYTSLVLEAAPDPALVATIGHAIEELARTTGAREIALPLGVGGHVDHRAVCAAHAHLSGPVSFYEDRPYAFAAPLVDLRLRALGAAAGPPIERQAARRALADAFEGWSFLRAYVPTAEERTAAVMAHLEEPAPPALAWPLVPQVEVFSEEELAGAAALVAGYGSQTPELFGATAAEAIARAYREAAPAPGGGFLERRYLLA